MEKENTSSNEQQKPEKKKVRIKAVIVDIVQKRVKSKDYDAFMIEIQSNTTVQYFISRRYTQIVDLQQKVFLFSSFLFFVCC